MTFDLPKPISTNKLYRKGWRGKTSEYEAWVDNVGWLLKEQRARPVKGPVHVLIEVSTKSRCDLDNCAKCVFDALVRAEVLPDDRRKYVSGGFDMRWSSATDGVRVTIKPAEPG